MRIPSSEFDLPASVQSGQAFRWRETSPGTWRGYDGGHHYLVTIRDDGPTRDYEIESNAGESGFRRLFRLEEPFEALADRFRRAAPELADLPDRYPGLRLMRFDSAVETTISFLCTPNNHLPRIVKMVDELAARGLSGTFPDLATLAAIPEAELRAEGFGYRAPRIPRVAQQILARGGESWLASLRETTYEDAIGALVELEGIGPKLADCIALFALHQNRAVPIDVHVCRAATRTFFPEWPPGAPTEKRYRAIGDLFRDRFGDLAGWAQQLVFYHELVTQGSRSR
ncbi:MAG TPA: DNA glycosylase [Fimbriimonadaceae bacterium]|nr:DNA glycosylase [Fimbriimonadaceae bacterium]